MESQIHEQTEELQTLEKAAEEAAEPEQIDEKAEQCRIESTPKAEPEDKIWLLCALIAVLVLGGAILFLQWQPKMFHPALALKIHRYLLGGLAISALLGVMRLVEVYAIGRLRNQVSRFNLKRVLRLLTALVAVFIAISVLFVNWYAAVVSLGLISLILGLRSEEHTSELQSH